MKVLHVIPSVGPLRGGPSLAIRNITEALSEHGVSVSVATTDDNADETLDVALGVSQVENGVTYRYFRRQTRFYVFSWPLYRWLASHVADYDLIHIHTIFSFASTAAAFLAARRSVPYVVRPLGTLNAWGIANRRPHLKQLSLQCIERPILWRAACVHYTSEQERIEASAVAPNVNGRVIPNPTIGAATPKPTARPGLLLRYPKLAGKRIVIFLSRLDAKKGIDLLLDAFKDVCAQQSDVVLLMAGGGEPKFVEGLKNRSNALQIAESVVWTGFLKADDKSAALAASDVFVLSSYSENFGMAVVEAMAASLPVVVSDQVAIHGEIETNGAGVVVSCAAGEIATALLRLLADPAGRKAMGERGRQFVEQEYSRHAVAGKLIGMYSEILKHHRSALNPSGAPAPALD